MVVSPNLKWFLISFLDDYWWKGKWLDKLCLLWFLIRIDQNSFCFQILSFWSELRGICFVVKSSVSDLNWLEFVFEFSASDLNWPEFVLFSNPYPLIWFDQNFFLGFPCISRQFGEGFSPHLHWLTRQFQRLNGNSPKTCIHLVALNITYQMAWK